MKQDNDLAYICHANVSAAMRMGAEQNDYSDTNPKTSIIEPYAKSGGKESFAFEDNDVNFLRRQITFFITLVTTQAIFLSSGISTAHIPEDKKWLQKGSDDLIAVKWKRSIRIVRPHKMNL